MAFIAGENRYQMMYFSLDLLISDDSLARAIDVFVNGLDLVQMGFKRTVPASEGRPAYAPKDLLKLYIYGNCNSVRSSRRLQRECCVNIEVKWLIGDIEPDFRTISDFRKDNVTCLKKVFHEFNKKVGEVTDYGYQSVDGSKFRACNAKDKNFTPSKLDDRIKRLDARVDEYLRLLDLSDADEGEELKGQFSRAELEEKIAASAERKNRYESYLRYMEENGLSQISLTDPDAKLMKGGNGFLVAHNVQTAVDSQTHMILNYEVTNQPTDHGLLRSTLESVKIDGEILEAVADKGYAETEDMAECLESGIIPNVIMPEGKDVYELEVPFEECPDAENLKANTDAESLKKCLRSGIVPEAYKDIIEKVEIIEKTIISRDAPDNVSISRTKDEMIKRANEGYFVRDAERGCVYCPAGEILRKKSEIKDGGIRYANRLACSRCPYKSLCTKSKWKEVDFPQYTYETQCAGWRRNVEGGGDLSTGQPEQKRVKKQTPIKKTKKKVVRIVFRPDRKKMANRKCLSEHPFGTIKRALDGNYFLLKGKKKVTGEFALISLAYNLKRAVSLLGFGKIMVAMR